MPSIGEAKRRPTAVGVTSGIGSMLVGPRQSGFRVVGNIEWRRYYHHRDDERRNTFTENFPGAFMIKDWDDLSDDQVGGIVGCDLVMAHAECGAFSNLRSKKGVDSRGACDIPLTTDLVARIRPRFFAMDNLPPSLGVFPLSEYVRRFPDYDIFPEWVSNWGYGNVQRNRNRLFVIGAQKSERFVFRPGEEVPSCPTLRGCIGDLCDEEGEPVGDLPNHHDHALDNVCPMGNHLRGRGDRATWADLRDYFREQRSGKVMEYVKPDGSVGLRFGLAKTHWEGPCHVLTKQNPTMHPLRNLPLTVRERARVMGFPDDFVFYGENLELDGTWDHYRNPEITRQTGKAMPVQFCRYLAEQVRDHIQGRGRCRE